MKTADTDRLRHLVEYAQDLIYYCDPNGCFTYVNPAASRVMGYADHELLGRHFMTLVRQDYRARAGETYARQILARTPSTYFEFPCVTKDGETVWMGQRVQLVLEDDRIVAVHAIARDITDRLALEEQLRQAQKMEAVGRLARGIAHDFNNVLAAIMGYSELIAARLQLDVSVRADANEIHKAAERGAALTRQLLAFSREQALPPRTVDLHAELLSDASMFERLAGAGVSVQLATPGLRPLVKIAGGQLDQVMLNLLVNARDAMPEGGTIDVTIDILVLDAAALARYPGLRPGRYAHIAVQDSGTGIRAEDQPHVFEPFFTTKDPGKGTGLGLSIVYGIAKDAGGTVTFTTTPGEGTTFNVLLPLVPDQAA